jgi:hypothetical protein
MGRRRTSRDIMFCSWKLAFQDVLFMLMLLKCLRATYSTTEISACILVRFDETYYGEFIMASYFTAMVWSYSM